MAERKSKNGNNPGKPRPVILCILDGWGHSDRTDGNAIRAGDTPNFDRWWKDAPKALLKTSGKAVGLPAGQMGNSEVGHMTIGGGRIILQDLPRIDKALEEGTVAEQPAFRALVDRTQAAGGTCHLMGLLSPGGVHSHQRHMAGLACLLADAGLEVRIHAFLDGRDTPPKSAFGFLQQFMADIKGRGRIRLATLSGRYFAMDRDRRWARVEKAWKALVLAEGQSAPDFESAIKQAYGNDHTDEFAEPVVLGDYAGMADGDSILMCNFRADRAREILTALVDPGFGEFERPRQPAFSAATGMVSYSAELDQHLTLLFPPVDIRDSLGEVASKAGLRQLRMAETEKYAHVTFFLNGGREDTFDREDRVLVPSPGVATYDLKPEMSAPELTDRLVAAIEDGAHDLIVVNYANPDMVGHTGNMGAAIRAVECVDSCLGRVESALQRTGGIMLVTADHGNVEQMLNAAGNDAHTAHTTLDVPVWIVDGRAGEPVLTLSDGGLSDIAPTILDLLRLETPGAMTGKSLLQKPPAGTVRNHAAE